MKNLTTLMAVLGLALWTVGCNPPANDTTPPAEPGDAAPAEPGEAAPAEGAADAPAEAPTDTPPATPEAGSTTE